MPGPYSNGLPSPLKPNSQHRPAGAPVLQTQSDKKPNGHISFVQARLHITGTKIVDHEELRPHQLPTSDPGPH